MYTLMFATGVLMTVSSTYELYKKLDNKNKICNYDELKSVVGEGVILSKHIRLSVKQSNEHVLMLAPSGRGKSRRFNMHNINNLQKCSLVVTDPSGELERTCKPNKKKYIVNPFSENTVGYDPLLNCRSEYEVKKIAGVILLNGMKAYSDKNSNGNQQDWVGMATPLFSAYMLMNFHTKQYNFDELIRNICTMHIVPKVAETDKNGKPTKYYKSIQEEIFRSGVESAIDEMKAFLQVLEAQQTLASIRTVMNSCLQVFLDKNMKRMFTQPNIDISKIRQEESVVYIQIPEHYADYYSPLTATLLTQMFDNYLERDGLQMYFILDEMCNIGVIPSICKILSTARKRFISIIASIQSITQLIDVYGEIQGKELRELFKTIMVGAGLKDSADYISGLLGSKEIRINGSMSTKQLMSSNEIRRMDEDEVLIICDNKRPVKDEMMEIMV